MFEDSCTIGRDRMSQSLCSFQESMLGVENGVKSTKIRQIGLRKEIEEQLLDIIKFQRECQLQIHILESIPEERKIAFEAYDKASALLNKLQSKQLNLNVILDKSMKMYDYVCISVNSVQNIFIKELEKSKNHNILYQKDIQDVKNVGNSTYEMLTINLNDKISFLDHLKKLSDKSDLIFQRKELNRKITFLDTQNDNISIKLENTEQSLNNLKENLSKLKVQENTLNLTSDEMNINFNTEINKLNNILDAKNKEMSEISERLKEQLISIDYIKNTKENIIKKFNTEKKLLSSLKDELNNNLNEIEMIKERSDELSRMKNSLVETGQIVDQTKRRILNLKNEYDRSIQNRNSLNVEITNFKKRIQKNNNKIRSLERKSKCNENIKLTDHLQKLCDNIQEIHTITENKIKFTYDRDNCLKQSISLLKMSIMEIQEKKRSKHLKNLENNMTNMELLIKDKNNKMDKLEKQYNNALIESKLTECLKYDIEVYYDILHKGIKEIQCSENQKKQASYLSEKLASTKKLIEENQKASTASLKAKMEELEELKFKFKYQVERKKEILSATQYDYFMAKDLLQDEQKTENELIAINEIVSFDIMISKSLMNWVKTSLNSDTSQKTLSQISQKFTQASTQKRTQESMQKSKEKFIQWLSKTDDDINVVSSATGKDMEVKKNNWYPLAKDIIDTNIGSAGKKASGSQKLPQFGVNRSKNVKAKKPRKKYIKKQHDQVKSLIDLIQEDHK